MNKIIALFKKYYFIIGCILLSAVVIGTMVSMAMSVNADADKRREVEARLEVSHRYTIRHRHAGRYSHTSLYYTDAYETDGQLVRFTNHDGRSMLVSGDITIVENNSR